MQRVAAVAASKPTAQLPENVFLRAWNLWGHPGPASNRDHILREQQKNMKGAFENKAFAILK